ncbi:glutathione S-transferase [Lasiosphaeria hispida]|uniref:Glutathione S-transferase n=1 Tax=Lasiosphaeria hispida TaxID=260671 RepID=A0AAJ0HCV3_9PEZI|nr:glutathione S-transferase [Lasiosphaeria hispida]
MASNANLLPIKVWGKGGPNPPKVAIVVEELGLPHEIVFVPITDVKKPEYTAINPNGRLPAIHDPNTGLTLWESGAIIEYLVDRYDVDNKISFPAGSNESYLTRQWLYFQVSGQGPYYGQAAWFSKFHPEKVPSALERYFNEIKRVQGVLEGHLKKQEELYGKEAGGPWLVGNKYTYADFAFLPWQAVLSLAFSEDVYSLSEAEFPVLKDWLARINAREPVARAMGTLGTLAPEK